MELRLRADRAKPRKGGIVRRKMLEQHKSLHVFLQAVKINTVFHRPYPWSIFLFRTQEHRDARQNFNFRDNPLFSMVALRMGDTGIIACLGDNGAQAQVLAKVVAPIRKLRLHPLQFTELTAKHFYKATLLNRVPKYLGIDDRGVALHVVSMPIQGWSAKPVFDEWDNTVYARMLSAFLGIPLDLLLSQDGDVWTWVYRSGRLNFIDIDEYDWYG